MTKKITKRERYAQLLAISEVASNKELVDFIKHEVELIDRKNTSRTMTKTQAENEVIKGNIYNILVENPQRVFTITEVIKALSESGAGDFTSQKISALMRQLVLAEKVKRIADKKRTVFQVAVEG